MNDFEKLEQMQKSENDRLNDENCITVKNIPDMLTKDDIYNYFKGYGYIKSIYFPKVMKGTMKYCFVEFKDKKIVEIVVKQRNINIRGHTLLVMRKKMNKKRF